MNASAMNLDQATSLINAYVDLGRWNDQMASHLEETMGAAGTDMWAHRYDDVRLVEACNVFLANGKEIPMALGFNEEVIVGEFADGTKIYSR